MKWGNIKNVLILLGVIITSLENSFAQDFTKAELQELRAKNMITQEDYNLLLLELGEGEYRQENLYILKIENLVTSDQYKVLQVGTKEYFPIKDFFRQINFKNYTEKNGLLIANIGDNLTELKIDKKSKYISFNKKSEKGKFDELVIYSEGDIYLKKELFSKYFLDRLEKIESLLSIDMKLNFTPPKIMEILLNKTIRELNEEKDRKEIIYEGKGKLFELGNARVDLEQIYKKDYPDKKSNFDWEGDIEYQGSLLYGDIFTGYDFKNKDLNDTYLKYDGNIVKDHQLEFGSYSTSNKAREWGISLKKDKGFYEEGKIYVIQADVPLGSRVELLYHGMPIEIQDAVAGKVTFKNSLIRSDNKYFLKIYSPDGKIELREITTTETYNHQAKGQLEYDIDLREHHETDKIKGKFGFYYGLTDNLTVGLGIDRELDTIKNKQSIAEMGRVELLYSDFIMNKYGYRAEYKTKRGIKLFEDNDNSYLKNRYIDNALFEVDINKFKFTFNNERLGKSYDEKNNFNFGTEYRVTDNARLRYNFNEIKYWQDETEKFSSVTGSYDYPLTKNLLVSTEVTKANKKKNDSYGVDLFYTGFGENTITFQNRWTGENSDYEGSVRLYNNNLFSVLDYGLEIGYSEKDKERATLEFTLRYDSIVELVSKFGEKGSKEIRLGVDTVFDLRNVKRLKPIESIDSMNVKATAFIDGNNNNIFDKGEKPLKNVDLEIENNVSTTDKNGIAYFSGILTGTEVDIKPKIRQPNYTLGNTSIKVKGRGTSTVEAFIPVKPMVTLSGIVDIDKNLKFSSSQIQQLYEDLIIVVKDKKGNIIEMTIPDEAGEFVVSGLFTDAYKVEIEYIGTLLEIPKLIKEINVAYNDNADNNVLVAISNKQIILNEVL